MRLKSFNYLIGLLIILFHSPVFSEDKIDIWKDNSNKKIDTRDATGSISEEKKNDLFQSYKFCEIST